MKQSDFASALLDPDSAVPNGLIDPLGRPAQKRFSVYRNNVFASLTRALEAGFPVIRTLVGPQFFGAMAVVFLRAHPPRSRQIMLYGDALPAFLETFPPVAHLPYLADVARLELALRDSYHAADSTPIDPTLLALPESELRASRFQLAPSVRLIRSRFPIHALWLANARGGPAVAPGGQDVLVLRAEYDPEPYVLPAGTADFLAALIGGATFEQSLNDAGEAFDLTPILSLLLSSHALIGISR